MHPSSGIRRTNVIVRLEDDNVFKQYRNFPPVVMGQVLLRLRSPRALFGRHRCEVEEKKTRLVRESGLPLAVEYIYFLPEGTPPVTVMKYKPCFQNVEEQIRSGVSEERAYELVMRCAAALNEFHCAGRTSKGFTLTHGDPFLENFVLVDGKAVLFDFEQEYRDGSDAVRLDRLIFFWHAADVLRECGHLEPGRLDKLQDAITTGYNGFDETLSGIGALSRLYFRARFM